MYNDTYVTESKFTLNGKEYPSKKVAEADLRKKGFSGSKLNDMLNKGKMGGKSVNIVKNNVDKKDVQKNENDKYKNDKYNIDLMNDSEDAHYDRDVRHEDDEADDEDNFLKDRLQDKHKYSWTDHEEDHENAKEYYDENRAIPKKLKDKLKEHIRKHHAVEAEYKTYTDKWDKRKKK
jgi:hypothetical protein